MVGAGAQRWSLGQRLFPECLGHKATGIFVVSQQVKVLRLKLSSSGAFMAPSRKVGWLASPCTLIMPQIRINSARSGIRAAIRSHVGEKSSPGDSPPETAVDEMFGGRPRFLLASGGRRTSLQQVEHPGSSSLRRARRPLPCFLAFGKAKTVIWLRTSLERHAGAKRKGSFEYAWYSVMEQSVLLSELPATI